MPLLPTPEEKREEKENPATYESELGQLELVAKLTPMDAAKLDELRNKLKAKYANG